MHRLITVCLCIALFLLDAETPARGQSASSFYPLSVGDRWIYWDYAWGVSEVWDTITTRVTGDSIIAGKRYFVITTQSARYGNTSTSYERIDSTGDALLLDLSTQQETLNYRLSDTSRSWWISRRGLQRFDSCLVRPVFGAARSLIYVGTYRVIKPSSDTGLVSTRILINGIGFYYAIPNALIDGGPTILAGGNVAGIPFGTANGVEQQDVPNLPLQYRLTEPFPNPFNPMTRLGYLIPKRSHVRLDIIDLLGNSVVVLLDSELDPGVYTVSWNASQSASGMYFCRLKAAEFVATKRLLLLK